MRLAFLPFLFLLAACETSPVETAFVESRDVRPADVRSINTVAIAMISASPAEANNVFTNRGELVSALNVFESELVNALSGRGMNVVTPQSSFAAFNNGLSYEMSYAMKEPNIATRAKNDGELAWMAKRLKQRVPQPLSKPSGLMMAGDYEEASNNLGPESSSSPLGLDMSGDRQRSTSLNTRLFPQMGSPPYITLPRNTENGGALDNRFVSAAARESIGQLASQAGADGYLLLEGQLQFSTREEGLLLSGITGGTRFVTYDGIAMLVKSDGRIAAVDRVRGQSAIPVGGRMQQDFRPEHGKGPFGYYAQPNIDNLREGAYQAVRDAALKLADQYAQYRGVAVGD